MYWIEIWGYTDPKKAGRYSHFPKRERIGQTESYEEIIELANSLAQTEPPGNWEELPLWSPDIVEIYKNGSLIKAVQCKRPEDWVPPSKQSNFRII